ncbi:MAG: TaqI family restriction endonuclease [Christensenellaceae bacterium]|jgi:hypothetical protein|nr:TaqI family restriction endonuclease [Christensenellaceae bacterium]
MAQFTREEFERFLASVDLALYRSKYSKIKTVEMDLPTNIQALDSVYEIYWENRGNLAIPPNYDEYYGIYYERYQNDIETFWHSTGFGLDCDCFKKGLEARIYRTWASLVTQIQAGYVAKEIFQDSRIDISTELDHKKVDILITKPNGEEIKIQVKKETKRSEIRRMAGHGPETENNGILSLKYLVPGDFDVDNPIYLRGVKKGQDKPWVSEFAEDGILKRLPNGFVIFRNKFFDGINIS